MKTYTYLKLFLISSLSFILMAGSCSNDDDEIAPEAFTPVTINLEDLGIELDDTSFIAQGFNFDCHRALSTDDNYTINGIILAYPVDQVMSSITLNLSNLNGLSKIIASTADQGNGEIELLNNGEVLETINIDINPFEVREFSFEINNREVDAFRYKSFEGFINYIRLE